MRSKLLIIFLVLATLSLGIIIGVLINDVPYFTVAHDIQLGAVFGATITGIVTLILAFSIPYVITKKLEDNKGIKQFLISEVTAFSKEVEKVRDKLDSCYHAHSVTNNDKMEITFLFEYLDKKIDSLAEQMEFSYPDASANDINNLKNGNNAFWRAVTGGELMDQHYGEITREFRQNAMVSYCKFDSTIKMIAHKIGKY